MSWAAGANRSSRVGEPPSKAEPSPSTSHPAVDLHSEPVRQPRLGHVSIPSPVGRPTSDPAEAIVDHLGEHPLPLGSGRGGRVTQYADFADRRDAPAPHRRQQVGERRAVARTPPVGQHLGRRNMQQY